MSPNVMVPPVVPLTMSAMFDSRVDTVKEAEKSLIENDPAKRFAVHI